MSTTGNNNNNSDNSNNDLVEMYDEALSDAASLIDARINGDAHVVQDKAFDQVPPFHFVDVMVQTMGCEFAMYIHASFAPSTLGNLIAFMEQEFDTWYFQDDEVCYTFDRTQAARSIIYHAMSILIAKYGYFTDVATKCRTCGDKINHVSWPNLYFKRDEIGIVPLPVVMQHVDTECDNCLINEMDNKEL